MKDPRRLFRSPKTADHSHPSDHNIVKDKSSKRKTKKALEKIARQTIGALLKTPCQFAGYDVDTNSKGRRHIPVPVISLVHNAQGARVGLVTGVERGERSPLPPSTTTKPPRLERHHGPLAALSDDSRCYIRGPGVETPRAHLILGPKPKEKPASSCTFEVVPSSASPTACADNVSHSLVSGLSGVVVRGAPFKRVKSVISCACRPRPAPSTPRRSVSIAKGPEDCWLGWDVCHAVVKGEYVPPPMESLVAQMCVLPPGS